VVLGDARLAMAGRNEKYGILVLDAYSSDSLPIHLITREALRLYLDRLEEPGILVFQASNRQLELEPVLAELSKAIPGTGPLPERYEAYKKRFEVSPDRLPAVFKAAIEESRKRTLQHIPLPPEETFILEYVKGKPWGGYNWYQGGLKSLIQVNTDLPSFVEGAITLRAREGYPGHHVYNALLEQKLVKGKGWVEFSVYPLFSPLSLIAEGSANYGVKLAFPPEDEKKFVRDVLFPLAGLDPAGAEAYLKTMVL
jgi:hypothetical protein